MLLHRAGPASLEGSGGAQRGSNQDGNWQNTFDRGTEGRVTGLEGKAGIRRVLLVGGPARDGRLQVKIILGVHNPLHSWWECTLENSLFSTVGNSIEFPQKLKIELPYDSAL